MQRVLTFPTARGFGDPSEFVTKRMCFSFMFSIGFLALLAGFLLGRFVFDQELELSRSKLRKVHLHHQQVFGVYKNYSLLNASVAVSNISSEWLLQHLTELKNHSDKSSDSKSLHEAKVLEAQFLASDFDIVSPLVQSQIHLSYPDPQKLNQVLVRDMGGTIWLSYNDSRPKFTGSSSEGRAASSSVEGDIVYVNFGRDEDYHYLDSLHISVNGRIVLARAGRILPMEMVTTALEHEVKGILLFLDPQQKDTALPLLSFIDLAKLQALHGRQNDPSAESVPVLIITTPDAERILKEMSSNDPSPESWRGDLKCNYPFGPGFSDPGWKLAMFVNTINVVKNYHDVLGAIRGSQEPDRFVMLANNRNPWATTADELRSTAVIMEIIRVLGELKKEKEWRPHRSIVIASWGLDGPEQHLSLHPESWWGQLEMKTVAYLKVQSTYLGNQTVYTRGTPILEQVLIDATRIVSLDSRPMDIMLQLGTDGGLAQHGVPFLELQDPERRNNGTLEKVAALWGVLTWNLADNHGLPFSLDKYDQFLTHTMEVVDQRFTGIAQKHALFLDKLRKSVDRLVKAIRNFKDKWSHAEKSKSIEMRIMNDQLLRFTHSFMCQTQQSKFRGISITRHMIFSRSSTGSDSTAGFGVLQDLLREITSVRAPEDLHQDIVTHLATLVECIDSARYTLSDGLDSFVMGGT